ncbi:MAG: chromosome partitioning protein ParB [Crocinitomicaceae bacterium]|nr:chromosome partitioning protein ParB [Crocinitomicaceae bacterium]|tara:strand:- start:13381 stop:14286 length:906 start_codon:yes stop_codon:yes gene_type:complete
MANKKRALGRGLSALLESADTDITSKQNPSISVNRVAGSISTIPIKDVVENPFQPRSMFTQEALEELAESIKVHGLIQPITVRKMGKDQFQLISGERRWRASKLAGLTEVPAYIRIANDQSMLEMALIENIQRENLDAIEIAQSYERLISECNLSQENMADRVGKKRSTVTNYLRLLNLPDIIQLGIREKKISMGHARALLAVSDPELQKLIFEKIVNEKLSVRKVEDLVKFNTEEESGSKASKPTGTSVSHEEKGMAKDLGMVYGNRVTINKSSDGKGKLVFHFKDGKDLADLIKKLKQD